MVIICQLTCSYLIIEQTADVMTGQRRSSIPLIPGKCLRLISVRLTIVWKWRINSRK